MKRYLVCTVSSLAIFGQLYGMKKPDNAIETTSPTHLVPQKLERKTSGFTVSLDASRQIAVAKGKQPAAELETTGVQDSEKHHSVRITVDTDRPSSGALLDLTTTENGKENADDDTQPHTSGGVYDFDFDLPNELSRMQPEELDEIIDSIVRQASISTFGKENVYCTQKLKKALLQEIVRIKRHSKPLNDVHTNDSASVQGAQDTEQVRSIADYGKLAGVICTTLRRRGAIKRELVNQTGNGEIIAAPIASSSQQSEMSAEQLKAWVLDQFKEREDKMKQQVRSERFKKYIGIGVSIFSTLGGIAAALITYYSSSCGTV